MKKSLWLEYNPSDHCALWSMSIYNFPKWKIFFGKGNMFFISLMLNCFSCPRSEVIKIHQNTNQHGFIVAHHDNFWNGRGVIAFLNVFFQKGQIKREWESYRVFGYRIIHQRSSQPKKWSYCGYPTHLALFDNFSSI